MKKLEQVRNYPANARIPMVDWVVENGASVAKCPFCEKHLRVATVFGKAEAVPCDCGIARVAHRHNTIASLNQDRSDTSRFGAAHRMAENRRMAEEQIKAQNATRNEEK